MSGRCRLVSALSVAVAGLVLVASPVGAGSYAATTPTAPPGTVSSDTEPAATTLETIPPGGSALPTTTESPISVSGPAVTAAPTKVKPGQRVLYTITGFQSPTLTASVCGNNALRGSVDCDQPHAASIGILQAGQKVSDYLTVGKPPAPCPCVVRVTNDTGDEVASAPLKIVGHKTGPLVHPPPANVDNSLLELSITATPLSRGFWHSAAEQLGASVTYDVTVSVKNRTDANLHDLLASGAVGRDSNDTIEAFALAPMPALPPGYVWRQKLRVTVPAPTFGDFHWRLSVSHNGVPVTEELVTNHRPWLLIALVVFIVLDIAALLVRGRLRARAKREHDGDAAHPTGPIDESLPDPVGADR